MSPRYSDIFRDQLKREVSDNIKKEVNDSWVKLHEDHDLRLDDYLDMGADGFPMMSFEQGSLKRSNKDSFQEYLDK